MNLGGEGCKESDWNIFRDFFIFSTNQSVLNLDERCLYYVVMTFQG